MSIIRANVFVGRERELDELVSALEDVIAGRGRLVLLSGEPGIGKSRLADELAGQARRRAARVLWGRCWESGGAPAYWPWMQSIRALVRDLDADTVRDLLATGAADVAQLVPELRENLPEIGPSPSVASDSARFRLFDATSTFLKRTAALEPLVLILDDLQVADTPSLLLLRFLAAELHDAHILVVGVYRDTGFSREHPLTTTVREAMRLGVTRRMPLEGLSRDQVAQYVALAAGVEPSAHLVAAIHAGTEGNPLFVGEVVRLLANEGRLKQDPGEGVLELAIPAEVRAVIAQRLEGMSDDTYRLLTLAAVLGREFELDALALASGLPDEQLTEQLGEAGHSRVIVDLPGVLGRLRFSHALVRDTLYEELPAIQRIRLHRRAGEVLESLHAGDLEPHLAELARHFLLAAPGGVVEKAVDYARRAGDRAGSVLAYEEAVRLYEMALTAVGFGRPPDHTIRCELLLACGDAQMRAGDAAAAKGSFLDAAEFARRHGMPEHLAQAALGYGGRFMWEPGRDDPRLRALLEEALAVLGDGQDELRAKVAIRLAAGPLRDDPDERRRIALRAEAVDVARRLGDRTTLAYALSCPTATLLRPDSLDERLALGDEIVLLAQEIGDLEHEHQVRAWRCCARWERGDMRGVYEDIEAQERLEAILRQPVQRWRGLSSRVVLATFEGRFDEVERLVAEAAEVGRAAAGPMAAVCGVEQLWALRREQGRLEEVVDELRTFSLRYPGYPMLRCELAHAYAELGRQRQARAEFESLAPDAISELPRNYIWIFGLCLLAEVAEYLGDSAAALRIYELLHPFRERIATYLMESGGSVGSVARPLGILAAMLGKWEAADAHFTEALEINVRVGARPWVARTEFDHARMLLARSGPGDGTRASELLFSARRTCDELGMPPITRRIDAIRADEDTRDADSEAPTLRREGEYWLVAFDSESFRLRDRKGLRYLSRLLAHPGRELHVLDLIGADLGRARVPSGSADVYDILDPQAKAAYQRRLEDLDDQLAEARSRGDAERAARAEEERDFLARELAAAFGLGGRRRRTGSAEERARVAVTQAIRTALVKMGEQNRPLGEHLARTVSTGAYCRYAPDPRAPIHWRL